MLLTVQNVIKMSLYNDTSILNSKRTENDITTNKK